MPLLASQPIRTPRPGLHLIKLAVGIQDFAHLARVQAARTDANGHVRHTTRQTPKRAPELLAGGSLYWVIGGAIRARQLLAAIEPTLRDDGLPAIDLVLALPPAAVQPCPMRPFQGWRYLADGDAPPDFDEAAAGSDLPESLLRALRECALI